MVRASQLARADDPGYARSDPLWRELAANLLPWRSAGDRQPHCPARHLGWDCDADRARSRWHPGDDRGRGAAELDQDQTQAATAIRGGGTRLGKTGQEMLDLQTANDNAPVNLSNPYIKSAV